LRKKTPPKIPKEYFYKSNGELSNFKDGFWSKNQYAAIPATTFTKKFSGFLCLECSILQIFFIRIKLVHSIPQGVANLLFFII